MQDLNKILDALTPEKRALLEIKLKENPQEFNTFPLSFAQRRLWFLHQLEPESNAYNIPVAIKLIGNLNISALKHSIDNIVMRHEILRSKIISVNETPYQLLDLNFRTNIDEMDLSIYDSQNRSSVLRTEIENRVGINVDLSKGPLFRITLFKLDERENLLLLVMHHIISDGWSIGVFINEFTKSYESYNLGNEPLLPKLEIQYIDFAKWQQNWQHSDNYKKQLKYWKTKLSPLPETLNLPTDYKRPATRKQMGNTLSISIEKEIQERLIELSHKSETSLFMICLAAFNIFLYKYTRQDDITVGIPIANRQKSELEDLIGFFVNTLVMRNYIDPNSAFDEFLLNIKTESLNAFEYQEIPFESLVEELHPERNMSQTPLFQVMFIYQSTPRASFNISGLKVESYEIENTSSKFDLTLSVTESNTDGLLLSIEYDTDLFLADSISLMLRHYNNLLKSIVQHPTRKLRDLSLFDEQEFLQTKKIWNKTYSKASSFEPVHIRIDKVALDKPTKLAIKSNYGTLTYAELIFRANEIAKILRSKDNRENSFVGVCMNRDLNLIPVLLGILKAGKAYLPIDKNLPIDRINFMLKDTNTETVISDMENHIKISKEYTLINVDSLKFDNRTDFQDVQIYEKQYAYIIYTSGSTGIPKGVAVTHESLDSLIDWGLGAFSKELFEGMLLSTSISFDVSIFELFVTLCAGGEIILAENILEITELKHFSDISTISTVPSAILELLRLNNLPPNIKYIHLAGELLSTSIVDELYKNPLIRDVFDIYGPTENTVYSTCKRRISNELPSIGKSIKNVKTYILDEWLNPVPTGVPGELYLGGYSLSLGYYNRSDLTASKFLPNPFSENQGERIYKTGDLVKMDHKGDVVYLSRVDDQVKLRGYRIELGEIESAMRSISGIINAAVVFQEFDGNDKYVIAYYNTENKSDIDHSFIRSELSNKIPHYMIPSQFIEVEKLPLLPSGKINRKLLPKPFQDNSKGDVEYISPNTDTEKKLAEIWSALLRFDKVGKGDNFFELGGHSLLATKCISRIRDAFKIDIPLRIIFEKPDLESLGRYIDYNIINEISEDNYRIKKISRSDRIPLSYAQERLWFIDKMDPDSSTYNIPSAFKIKGKPDLLVFKRAFDKVIARHEVLRTSIETSSDGIAYQKIHDKLEWQITEFDLSDLAKPEKEVETIKIVNSDIKQKFDLNSVPLFRVSIINLGYNEFMLLFTMHHIISDGWSIELFYEEFSNFYNSILNESEYSPAPLAIQYADFSNWQRDWLEGEKMSKQLQFWREELKDIPSLLELPLDKNRPAVQTFQGRVKKFNISREVLAEISSLCNRENITPFMFFLTVFFVLLNKISRQNDISVGTPVANRNNSQIESLIGFFVNTIVIRQKIYKNLTFKNLLDSVRKTSLGAYSNQDIPFEKLVDSIDVDRDTSHTPIFQVMFLYQSLFAHKFKLHDIEIEQVDIVSDSAKFDITLTLSETDTGKLAGAVEYNSDIFDSETIDRFIDRYIKLVNSVLHDPELKIQKLDVLTNAEKELILNEWNDTKFDYDSTLIHKLIDEAAVKSPNSIAVSLNEESISYDDLAKKSNQLANYLKAKGIGLESKVGVSLDPSVEMIIVIVAILKAGATYVPLDPKYPSNRIEYIINDSHVKTIITQNHYIENFVSIISVLVIVDEDWDNIMSYDNSTPDIVCYPDSLAYVIYTSGSTGNPKGVACAHKGVINMITDVATRNPKVIGSKWSLWTSLNFDASVYEIFTSICFGGELNIIPEETRPIAAEFFNLLADKNISCAYVPPFFLEEFAHWLEQNPNRCKLKNLMVGVEPIKSITLTRIKNNIQDVLIVNAYGPTEITVLCICYNFENSIHHDQIVPIGGPTKNTKIYLLDEELYPVPIGSKGEIYISSPGLARGYLNNPKATAEKFIPNPFSETGGERLYKTGDLAKYTADGNITFAGRMDYQVKIRGFRVELGEIENILKRIEYIKDAVVILAQNEEEVKRIIGYYKSLDDKDYPQDEIFEYLSENLPSYMVPAQLIQIEKIPLLPNGKVNRNALPKPISSESNKRSNYQEPKTEREIILADAIKEVLKLNSIGIHDNFFELGGDSIIAIQVIAKVKQSGYNLTPVQLFQHQTIHKLATVLTKIKTQKAKQGIVTGYLNYTPIQKLFIEKKFKNRNHWNQSILFKVNRTLDIRLLEETCKAVALHHDSLRMRLIENSFGDLVLKSEYDGLSLEVVDISEENDVSKDKIENVCSRAQGSLNLENGPLFKVVYFKLANEGRLFFVFHHIIIDGVSWRIFLEDFLSIYSSIEQNAEKVLPLKTTSVKEWSNLMSSFAASKEIVREANYWLNLTETNNINIDTDFNKGSNLERFAKSISFELEENDTNNLLMETNKKYNTKIDEILLTALLISFSKWSGKRSLMIFMEGHGRNYTNKEIDLSRTIGWFTSLYPLKLDLMKSVKINEIIKTVKEQVRGIPNEGFGYGYLRYLASDSQIKNKLSVLDSVGITFNYLGQLDKVLSEDSMLQIAGENKGPDRDPENERMSLIEITASVSLNKLIVNFTYSENQFTGNSITEWADAFKDSLREIIQHCISDFEKSYTASDFELANLNDKKLGKVISKLKKKK